MKTTTKRKTARATPHFDPAMSPRGRLDLGEGVVLRVDVSGPAAGMLRFMSEWADGAEREALRMRPPTDRPDTGALHTESHEPFADIPLSDRLHARITKCGTAFVWCLLAVWANGDEKELYRVVFSADPASSITYPRGTTVKYARPRPSVVVTDLNRPYGPFPESTVLRVDNPPEITWNRKPVALDG